MKFFKNHFYQEVSDPRINVSLFSPKATIINSLLIMLYSGILLSISQSIDFIPENGAFLAGSILTLIIVSSITMAALASYMHYTLYTKPLLRIAKAAREVSSGNYTVQLPPHRIDGKTDVIDALYLDFNSMVRELSSTEILKSSFISNVSHELKTPISVISNYSSLMVSNNLDKDEEKEYSKKIQAAASDLSELITNILQITKLDNNQITVNPLPFNISETLIQCILGYEMI
nr:HAMP domain-containing histidine kinase [Lachnospiraceae bacterium]